MVIDFFSLKFQFISLSSHFAARHLTAIASQYQYLFSAQYILNCDFHTLNAKKWNKIEEKNQIGLFQDFFFLLRIFFLKKMFSQSPNLSISNANVYGAHIKSLSIHTFFNLSSISLRRILISGALSRWSVTKISLNVFLSKASSRVACFSTSRFDRVRTILSASFLRPVCGMPGMEINEKLFEIFFFRKINEFLKKPTKRV